MTQSHINRLNQILSLLTSNIRGEMQWCREGGIYSARVFISFRLTFIQSKRLLLLQLNMILVGMNDPFTDAIADIQSLMRTSAFVNKSRQRLINRLSPQKLNEFEYSNIRNSYCNPLIPVLRASFGKEA